MERRMVERQKKNDGKNNKEWQKDKRSMMVRITKNGKKIKMVDRQKAGRWKEEWNNKKNHEKKNDGKKEERQKDG